MTGLVCVETECSAEAVGCDECRRALALKWFGGISRHPEAGMGCLVCEDGPPVWCAGHLVRAVAEYRTQLRSDGRVIARWPDYPDLRSMHVTVELDSTGRPVVVAPPAPPALDLA